MKRDEMNSIWMDPPAIYRGAPFWSWNSKLEPDRLLRQIESMHRGGMGGFFMHSRYGLKTPYLSDEWFECISACVEKARELGMKAYLYDEDRWPSGPAGGWVTRENPQFRCHYLAARDPRVEMTELPLTDPGGPQNSGGGDPEEHLVETLGTFRVTTDDVGSLDSYKTPYSGLGDALLFEVRTETPNGWTNDGGYLDTMNPEAVEAYIKSTHDEYAKRYGDDFGSVIPALFTDEPNYGYWNAGPAGEHEVRVLWTRNMLAEFKTRRGYDLAEHLPELVLHGADGFSKVRHDYHQTLTELFVEHFSKRCGEWCEEHGLALTGHYLLEGALDVQTKAAGACMPHYEYQQWPGIDILTDQTDELITAKQCSSVADQLGKERVLSELYGCTGWDWPLEGHKFQGDWQYAVGVNFRCQHLTHYSLAGGAKRDYPASIIDHAPWWDYYRHIEDYFGRLSFMLTQGKPVRDVLVIHPIQSAWGLYTPAAAEQPAKLGEVQDALTSVMRALTSHHYDWDFGDESLMAKYASVAGARIAVGQMSYKLVVVPPCVTLRKSTVALLESFIEGGGKVLFAGAPPTAVDGESGGALDVVLASAECCGSEPDELIPAVEAALPRRVSIMERDLQQQCMWSMLREIDGGAMLFVQSHDREAGHRVRVTTLGAAPVVRWDLLTGGKTIVEASEVGELVDFHLDIPQSGSALLTLGVVVPDAAEAPGDLSVIETRELDGPYEIELTEENTFPLDYCDFSTDDDGFSEVMPTLMADKLIRAKFGLGTRVGNEHQPWHLYATGVVDTTPRERVRLRWMFHVTDVPVACALAVENPEDYGIFINGSAAGDITGFWVDEDIKRIDITDLIVPGQNEVLLTCDYRPDMEIEDMYLVGDFGAARMKKEAPAPGNMTLVQPPIQLQWGTWVGQGLDFYGAGVKHAVKVDAPEEGQRLRVSLPEVACSCAAAHVNGETFVMPWAPFEADVTDALDPGENEITIEVIGGRKNILGPLHTPWGPGTGPHSFSPDHAHWTREYHLTEHGLLGPVVVEVLE